MEKMTLMSEKIASQLRSVSEPALENWSESLYGIVGDEVLEYFKGKVRRILEHPSNELSHEPTKAGGVRSSDNPSRPVLLLDEVIYRSMREELSKTFGQQLRLTGLGDNDLQVAEKQIDALLHAIDESVELDLMSELLREASKLDNEKRYIKKTLYNVTQLLERDRQRLAFDLHDGPAQAISSAILQADILEDLVASAEAKRELASLKSILGQCLQDLRMSIYSLKPPAISRKGMVARIDDYVKQFSIRTGIKVEILVNSEEREIPEVVEINVFRIIQEALSNIRKHSRADNCIVNVMFSDAEVSFSIDDNGIGLDADDLGNRTDNINGYGLISMRDRVGQFSGVFEVSSEAGKGTCISFSIPL